MSEPTGSLVVDIRMGPPPGGVGPRIEVAFEAPPGVTILFGPSGVGKSTTLQAIAGLMQPERGRIALGGQTWFDAAQRVSLPIEQRGLAYVFQSLALFPHMSALDNVAYGVERSLGRDRRRAHAIQMLERMHVGHLRDRRPATFSGGEAQRVALARAFARSPRLILLDEPFSAMDRELRRDFAQDIRTFIEESRIPMVHVTHHRNEARALGDRVVLLEAGRVKTIGPVEQLLPAADAALESTEIQIRRGGEP